MKYSNTLLGFVSDGAWSPVLTTLSKAGGNVESDHEICEMSLRPVLTTLSLIVSS
jgi:hypothetical protein